MLTPDLEKIRKEARAEDWTAALQRAQTILANLVHYSSSRRNHYLDDSEFLAASLLSERSVPQARREPSWEAGAEERQKKIDVFKEQGLNVEHLEDAKHHEPGCGVFLTPAQACSCSPYMRED